MHEQHAVGATHAASAIPLGASPRRIAANLGPGMLLPGLIYFVVSRFAPMTVALAAASSVPAVHACMRLARGRRPSPYGLVFLAVTATSVGLAMWLRSPMLILARGAAITAILGFAFAVSVIVRRPLTRTFALFLSRGASRCPPQARRALVPSDGDRRVLGARRGMGGPAAGVRGAAGAC